MSPCCPVEVPKPGKTTCPACGSEGRAVATATLYHQICFPDNLSIPATEFYYCAIADCEVAYFSDSGISFRKTQLREYAHIQSGWLCYCFDISKAAYRDALLQHRADDIRNFVIEQTKTGTCACTTRNPSGQCCLADFKRFEKEHRNEQR